MSRRRITVARARAIRVSIALVAALACLGAAAYAASRPEGPGRDVAVAASSKGRDNAPKGGQRPLRPRITSHPEAVDTGSTARFVFSARGPGLRFQCKLDGAAWKACRSPHTTASIAAGAHSFSVRAVRKSVRGPSARFKWTKVDPQPLTVEPRPTSLTGLYPGGGAQAIPVRIANPNSVAVTVTSLTVAVSADPPGCPADPNLELGPSSLSPTAPLVLPAGGELTLPTAAISAPTIALRELPFNQDACQGASFPLRLDAEARG